MGYDVTLWEPGGIVLHFRLELAWFLKCKSVISLLQVKKSPGELLVPMELLYAILMEGKGQKAASTVRLKIPLLQGSQRHPCRPCTASPYPSRARRGWSNPSFSNLYLTWGPSWPLAAQRLEDSSVHRSCTNLTYIMALIRIPRTSSRGGFTSSQLSVQRSTADQVALARGAHLGCFCAKSRHFPTHRPPSATCGRTLDFRPGGAGARAGLVLPAHCGMMMTSTSAE